MEELKRAVCAVPAFQPINYLAGKPVIMSVNLLYIVVGFILAVRRQEER